ncbi:hypothetical protein ACOMHN_057545 [Nucella lapillus]
MDTAHLNIYNDRQADLSLLLFTQTEECHECDLMPVTRVETNNCTVLVDTRWPVRVEVRALKNNTVQVATPSCRRGVIHRMMCCWNAEHVMADFGPPTSINPTEDSGAGTGSTADSAARKKRERLRSLDTFRGFVFIMGTAMILSFQPQLQRGTPKLSMLGKIVRRSLILFALGLLINSGGSSDGVDLSRFRIPGVLQRFAGTYLIVATVHLLFAKPFDDSRVMPQGSASTWTEAESLPRAEMLVL